MSTYAHDLKSALVLEASSYPATVSTNAGGTTIDLLEGEGRCFAIQLVGAISGDNPSLTGKIQESDDNDTWSDIAGASFSAVNESDDVQIITFERTKRYVRHYRTISGVDTSIVLAAVIGQQLKRV